MTARPAGARPVAAPLVASLCVALALAAGCSSASSTPHAAATPVPAATSPAHAAATPTVDPAAARAIAAATREVRALRSYRWVADDQVVATTRLRSHLTGSVVRGQGLTYRLTVGRRQTQVVRLRNATYVRTVPHRWSRLRHPRHLANPTATLLAVLHDLRPNGLARNHGVTAVHGQVAAADARAIGIPASKPAEVTVTLDRVGRVVGLDIETTTQANGRDVRVSLRTSYGGFGRVGRIRKPV